MFMAAVSPTRMMVIVRRIFPNLSFFILHVS
jgi:hypothetical protein